MIARTRLRGYLPWWLVALVPKRREPCIEHDWYVQDAETWACYDCPATRRPPADASPRFGLCSEDEE